MENRVGFWLRVAASLIDGVIVIILAVLFMPVAGSLLPGAIDRALAEATQEMAGRPGADQMTGFVTTMARFGVSLVLIGLPYALIEALTGASPGKRLLGLRIVDEAGQIAPVSKLLMRFAVKNAGGILSLVGVLAGISLVEKAGSWVGFGIVLGFFLVLTRPRQALHDKIAATAVLRKSDVGATAPAPTPAASL